MNCPNPLISIQDMKQEHGDAVLEIFEQGIKTGNATFRTDLPSWSEWNQIYLQKLRLVASAEDTIIGWIALLPYSQRSVYSGVAEVSLYIHEQWRGRGVGCLLLNEVVKRFEQEGFWTLQASIFPENKSSVYVHESCGFRVVGRREKLGKLNGEWRDTVLLERRSHIIF